MGLFDEMMQEGADKDAEIEKWKWVARQAARHAAGRDNAAAYIAQMLERYEQRDS